MSRLEESLYYSSSDDSNSDGLKCVRGLGYGLLMVIPLWVGAILIGDKVLDSIFPDRQYPIIRDR